ncbi:MAG: hypothetical protein FWG35_08705, partial [Spirochaetaceae bacterium]|nr:hypothetical protein [Spirochaetaceae bacterium]
DLAALAEEIAAVKMEGAREWGTTIEERIAALETSRDGAMIAGEPSLYDDEKWIFVPPNYGTTVLIPYETVPVMDFESLGPIILTAEEVREIGPLGLWESRTGSRITWADLMAEAARRGADDVINVRVEESTRVSSWGSIYTWKVVTTYTATALAIKYTGVIEQLRPRPEPAAGEEAADKEDGLARYRAEGRRPPEERAAEKQRYARFGIGGWYGMDGGFSDDRPDDTTGKREAYMVFADFHLTPYFGFAVEIGQMNFFSEDKSSFPPTRQVGSEFITAFYNEFSLPLGSYFQLDLLAGLYRGGRHYSGGVIYGANARLKLGSHNFFALARIGGRMNRVKGMAPRDDEIWVLGGGYIYSPEKESLAPDNRRVNEKDEEREAKKYPFFRIGGWGGVSAVPERSNGGKDYSRGWGAITEFQFAGNVALCVEGGMLPFPYRNMANEKIIDSFFTVLYCAEIILKPLDVFEIDLLAGFYTGEVIDAYWGFSGGANAGFKLGQHYLFAAWRFARDRLMSPRVQTSILGLGYKYDVY